MPILRSPDFCKPFVVQCDASDTGVGGVLTQDIYGKKIVTAFISRGLTKTERKYITYESASCWQCYIDGILR